MSNIDVVLKLKGRPGISCRIDGTWLYVVVPDQWDNVLAAELRSMGLWFSRRHNAWCKKQMYYGVSKGKRFRRVV